jgi:hypothetical protein
VKNQSQTAPLIPPQMVARLLNQTAPLIPPQMAALLLNPHAKKIHLKTNVKYLALRILLAHHRHPLTFLILKKHSRRSGKRQTILLSRNREPCSKLTALSTTSSRSWLRCTLFSHKEDLFRTENL